MNDIELGYVAGVIEGEGYIFTKNSYSAAVAVQMTDLDVLQKLQILTGLGHIIETQRQKPHHKRTWRWTAQGSEVRRLLLDIYPHMGDRRKEKIMSVVSVYDENQKVRSKREDLLAQAVVDYESGKFSLRTLGNLYGVSRTSIWRAIHKNNN